MIFLNIIRFGSYEWHRLGGGCLASVFSSKYKDNFNASYMTQKTMNSLGTTLALPTHDNLVPVTTHIPYRRY